MKRRNIGPQFGDNQRIAENAKNCFRANLPDHWIATALDGDSDFGLDFQIQFTRRVGDCQILEDLFFVQIKGSENPKWNASRDCISMRLDIATCEYFSKQAAPVMLVFCDLSVEPAQAKNCIPYYCWFDQDSINQADASGTPSRRQKTITVRIPRYNVIGKTTDVSSHLEIARDLREFGQSLDRGLKSKAPGISPLHRVETIGKAIEGINARSPILLDSLASRPTTSWVEAPKNSLPWLLNQARQALRQGNDGEAEISLATAKERLAHANDLELADYWYLVGLLRSQQDLISEARDAFLAASQFSENQTMSLIAWAESFLILNSDLEQPDFSTVLSKLDIDDAEVKVMRARLLAAEGRFADARAEAEHLEGFCKHFAIAMIATAEDRLDEVLSECEAGLVKSDMPERTKQNFLILRAHSSALLSVFGTDNKSQSVEKIANPKLLTQAWSYTIEAARSLQASGWTGSLQTFVQTIELIATVTNNEEIAIEFLLSAARSKPKLSYINETLTNLFYRQGNPEQALRANAKVGISDSKILHRVNLLYELERLSECLEEFKTWGFGISPNHPLFGIALINAIDSAERLVRSDDLVQLELKLKSHPEESLYRAVLRLFRELRATPLSKEKALLNLEEDYLLLGKPSQLGRLLFFHLDPRDPLQAIRCLELGSKLHDEILLDLPEILHLAQSLATLGNWERLFVLADESIHRFGRDEQLMAIKAIALDKLGATSESLELLRHLASLEEYNNIAINFYVEVATRCGLINEAVSAVEKLLSRAHSRQENLRYLQLLFRLLQLQDPSSARCLEVAHSIGGFADPHSEAEEASYLIATFFASTFNNIEVEDSRIKLFQRRLIEFTNRFPSSKLLYSFIVSEERPVDDLIQAIQIATGNDESKRRAQERLSNEIERGQLAVPFALRPNILQGGFGVSSMWEACKNSGGREKRFRLIMTVNGWSPTPISILRAKIPLLDFLTINIIHDLGLWEALFSFFPKIAICKETLLEIANELTPIFSKPFAKKVELIQATLKQHLDRIVQPQWDAIEDGLSRLPTSFTQTAAIVRNRGADFSLYSDDFLFRRLCIDAALPSASLCTLDLIEALVELNLLDERTAATKIALLAHWNVHLNVGYRYLAAIVPDEARSARSTSDAIGIVQNSEPCRRLYGAIWTSDNTFEELIREGCSLLRFMIIADRYENHHIAIVIGTWYFKAILHRDARPSRGNKILGLLIARTAMGIQQDFANLKHVLRRLWEIFVLLVEVDSHPWMDEKKEREAIEAAGEIAAELDNSYKFQMTFFDRLSLGLIRGTSRWESFAKSYQRYIQGQIGNGTTSSRPID